MIVNELLESARKDLKNSSVKDVRIGISYIGVLLEGEKMGLSYTFREEVSKCCEVMEKAGELESKNPLKLAKLALKPRIIDSGVGIATINAIYNQEVKNTGDILEFLDLRDGESVGMIGDFKPLVENIEAEIDLHIFERNRQDDKFYPDWAVDQFLPKEDVVIISGTTLVNKTIDHILELSRDAREVIVLGPTTPMAPEIFKKREVTTLGGTVIRNPEKALDIISQGGGTRKIHKVSKKVNLIL